LIQECNAELDTKPEPLRAARLHYEVARLTEVPLHDYRRATTHYRKAHELWPDHVPSIRGARRLLLRSKQYKLALPLFDAEIRLATDPHHKASLLVAKGRTLEDGLRQKNDARDAYVAARELDPNNPIVLKALEQADWDASNWEALSQNYATTANAIHQDPKLRAAVMCQRARIEETKLNRPEAAIEIYANALTIDATSTAALSSLRRLHQTHKR
jgi:tetratricopeptide (TPR) repeat protein